MELAALEQAGLSKREAKLYLVLLDQGTTTVGPLITKSNIPSSKIYEILHKLEERGLASHIIIKRQKHFQAANPRVILQQLEEKQQAFKKHLSSLLERRRLSRSTQSAEFYEGKEAIFSLLRHLVRDAKPGDNYYNFSLGKELIEPDIVTFFSGFTRLRKEKGLTVKVLLLEKDRDIITKAYDKDIFTLTNARFTKMAFPKGAVILNDSLILMELEGTPSAIRIRCDTFAKNYEQFFNALYDQATL